MSLICNKCKQEITDVAYINVRGFIVIRTPGEEANLMMSAETREHYKEELNMHDSCFIQTLIDHGKTNLRHP